jgi:alkanesulfonate monooxygenase SsuD/methylene tetrahydromethanopterin reductase-like flavin-dependent oxidoreductase (luciferase family)
MALKLGLYWIPGDIRRAVDLARLADGAGFPIFGVCDSPILYDDAYPVITACLAATESIEIGPNMTNPVTRHWSVHAATLRAHDRLAPGRAMLGIAAGDGAVHSLGLRPADDATFADAVEQIRQAAPGCGSIHIAAGGPKRARLAGRHADAALLGCGLDVGALQALGDALDAGSREAPTAAPRVERWAMAHLNIVDREGDLEAARTATLPLAVAYARHHFSGTFASKNVPLEFQQPFRERLADYRFTSHAVPGDVNPNARLFADRPDLADYAMTRFTIVGTADQCRARIERLADEADLDGLWLSIVVPDPETLVERAGEAFQGLLRSGAR